MTRDPFTCIVCGEDCELDDFEPFCSAVCKDNYDPPEPDGEAFRGGEAAAYQAEQAAAAWRLK